MSVTKVKISPTMKECLEYAELHGNVLRRYQGGFWAKRGWQGPRVGGSWFGSATVNALIDRGLAEVTEWQEGRSSRFPIQVATLKVQL